MIVNIKNHMHFQIAHFEEIPKAVDRFGTLDELLSFIDNTFKDYLDKLFCYSYSEFDNELINELWS